MMKIGKNVYITNNLNYQRYEVNCIPKGDCVIFISYSGETKTLINMAKTCQKKNIPFLSLTSFGENTLSQMSDAIFLQEKIYRIILQILIVIYLFIFYWIYCMLLIFL